MRALCAIFMLAATLAAQAAPTLDIASGPVSTGSIGIGESVTITLTGGQPGATYTVQVTGDYGQASDTHVFTVPADGSPVSWTYWLYEDEWTQEAGGNFNADCIDDPTVWGDHLPIRPVAAVPCARANGDSSRPVASRRRGPRIPHHGRQRADRATQQPGSLSAAALSRS